MHTIPAWSGRRATDALTKVKSEGQRRGTPCHICHGPINYQLRYPNPSSCSVQHIISRSLRPDLTWDPNNWAPCHLVCNQQAGDGTRTNPYDLGMTS